MYSRKGLTRPAAGMTRRQTWGAVYVTVGYPDGFMALSAMPGKYWRISEEIVAILVQGVCFPESRL
jgi:hypothetical protein